MNGRSLIFCCILALLGGASTAAATPWVSVSPNAEQSQLEVHAGYPKTGIAYWWNERQRTHVSLTFPLDAVSVGHGYRHIFGHKKVRPTLGLATELLILLGSSGAALRAIPELGLSFGSLRWSFQTSVTAGPAIRIRDGFEGEVPLMFWFAGEYQAKAFALGFSTGAGPRFASGQNTPRIQAHLGLTFKWREKKSEER